MQHNGFTIEPGADLREADLRGADLRRADLCAADLRRADLSGADLRGADLRGADIERVKTSEGTNLLDAGCRSDGYRFIGLEIEGEPTMVFAGCRRFTMAEARKHWGLAHPKHAETRPLLDRIEGVADDQSKYERLRDAWRHRWTYATDSELHSKVCRLMNHTIDTIEAEGK